MKNFSFTRQEKRGILYVSLIILITISYRCFLPRFTENETPFDTLSFEHEIKEFENRQLTLAKEAEEKQKKHKKTKYINFDKKYYKSYKNKTISKYYKFDPNTAKITDWKNFGFTEKQSKVIVNYIKRSGRIKSKSELKNIFVINERKYRELYPFINIKENSKNKNETVVNLKNKIELNSATIKQLVSVNGIGKKTAERIIKYRDILGGFYSLTQLNEVYGISEENYMKMKLQLKINRLSIKRINVNFADKQEFARNPYISFEEAKNIIKYKVNNGAFKSVNDLFINKLVTNEKLRYYLTIE